MHKVIPLLRARITAIWLLLTAATIVTWALGHQHHSASLAAVTIISIAIVKIRLVGLYFMELRTAPAALRLIFEGYCLAVGATLIAMYLLT